MTKTQRVLILQDYVPHYRAALFDLMINQGAELGLNIKIASGATAAGEQRRRNDSVTLRHGHLLLRQREIRILGKRVLLRGTSRMVKTADIVVFEQARRNVDLYAAFARRVLGRKEPRLALWGHGGSYVKDESNVEQWLRRALTRRADWFFAYTPRGASEAESLGLPQDRITTLFNTIDIDHLRQSIASLADVDLKDFQRAHHLTSRTCIYIGGLDASKEIASLLRLARECHHIDPEFRLLIAGDGPDRSIVEEEADRSLAIQYLGPVDGKEKALALSSSQFIVITGRVGLAVTDGYAAGIPVATVAHERHAPEAEYIRHGVTGLIAKNLPNLRHQLLEILHDAPRLADMQRACAAEADRFTVSAYGERFLQGLAALSAKTSR